MEGGAADDDEVEEEDEEEGALHPGEICSAFRTRSGCCRSLWGRTTRHELGGSCTGTFSQHLSPDDVVDTDDAVGPGGPRVVDDGEVALHPHPAARLRQEAVVLGARLALVQHCKK